MRLLFEGYEYCLYQQVKLRKENLHMLYAQY